MTYLDCEERINFVLQFSDYELFYEPPYDDLYDWNMEW
jgi:hypothetical protein